MIVPQQRKNTEPLPRYEGATFQLAPVRPRATPLDLTLLFVAARMLVCLAAIGMGLLIAANAPNDGVAVLAALACGGVIYGLLGGKRS